VLSNKKTSLNVKCAKSVANINGIDADEFPQMPVVNDDYKVTIDNAMLQQIINQTVFSAASDESRPILAGVNLIFGEKLVAAATDGFRLARKIVDVATSERNITVPARALAEVTKLFSGNIDVSIDKSQILFCDGKTIFVSRLIEGVFPKYEMLIPSEFATKTTVKKDDFYAAVKRASFFSRESANVIKLDISEGVMKVNAISAEVGDNNNEIDANVDGETIVIAFNADYLLSIINACADGEIVVKTNSSIKPCIIDANSDYMFLIMPLQLPK
jgi:DNA polymerase-3 subunit beta